MEIEDGVATFPNGLQLRLTPSMVSPQAIYEATLRHPDPSVPQRWIENLKRHEENPDDPAYLQAKDLAAQRRAWAATRAMLILATDLVKTPAGLDPPDQIDWERLAAVRDMPAPTNKLDRYETWLRYWGLTHSIGAEAGLREFRDLVVWLSRAAGVTMEGVATVVATFRDTAEQSAGDGSGAMASTGHRDDGGQAARDNSPSRP